QGDGASEHVGAEPVPVGAAGGAAGEDDLTVHGGAEQVEVVEAEPLDERRAAQDGDVPLHVVGGLPERERLRVRGREREPLAPRDQRVGDRQRVVLFGAVAGGGGGGERVQVTAREVAGEDAGAGARRAARQPRAVRGAGRVADPARV